MTGYDEHLCRAMDEQHYAHYEQHRGLWDRSLYEFLNIEYRRLFETIARAFPQRPIEVHYVGPGLNYPCLKRMTWEPIASQIREVHLYDIDERVLDVVARVVPRVLRRTDPPPVEGHRLDITAGMGGALLEWAGCVRDGVARVKVPWAEYFEGVLHDDGWCSGSHPDAARNVVALVISEMAVSSTGLGVFWELYDSPTFHSLGVTPGFVNLLEQVYNTCVARRHFQWISRLTAGRGVAIVSADVERIYHGMEAGRRAPTFAAPLSTLARECSLRVESAAESVWLDIPAESAVGIPPHSHRIVCCTASDRRSMVLPWAGQSPVHTVGAV